MSSPVGTRVYNKRDGQWEGNSLERHSGPIPLHTSTEGFSLGKSRGELNRDMMMGLIETLGQKLSRGGGLYHCEVAKCTWKKGK